MAKYKEQKMTAQNMALTKNKDALELALAGDAEYINNLLKDPRKPKALIEFKSALIELSGNAYLMEKIPAAQIVRVAAQATYMGLSVNPLHKECDILPFNVKGKGVVASIVAKKKGVQEMAFSAGFFFDVDPVWSIPNLAPPLPPEIAMNLPEPPEMVIKAESEMTREELIGLDPSDPKFFNEHMKGWDFTLTDMLDNDSGSKVQPQKEFVSLKDAKAVTGSMQATEHSLKQAYVHKAIRRAMTEFYIPRNRNSSFLKMIEVDDKQAIEVEVIASGGVVDAVTSLGNDSGDDADSILLAIKGATTIEGLQGDTYKRANANTTDRRPELIKAYKAKKAELENGQKKPFAIIMSDINKAKTVKEVDAETLILSHLSEDQKTEVLNAAENQKHVISTS